MPTGFEKFAGKALSEEPIVIGGKKEQTQSPEGREVEKLGRVTRVGTVDRKPAPVRAVPETKIVEEEKVQITIKISSSMKDKLDWLKFSQKRTIIELTEEAIEDLYQKYKEK